VEGSTEEVGVPPLQSVGGLGIGRLKQIGVHENLGLSKTTCRPTCRLRHSIVLLGLTSLKAECSNV